MRSWKKKYLAEVADFCLGKMLDQKKNRGEFLPYLANVNVRWGEFDLDNLREMRFELHEKERYGLKYGDIVLCEGGEPGRCAIWKDNRPDMMIQKALHRIRPQDGLDNRFLYYSFLYKGKTGGFTPLFTGATIKHLPRQNLAKVKIDFPSLSIQQRIADILSAYDDLIENNLKRIKLLEEAAQLLYHRWFVDFKFPGYERAKFIKGVPEGWEKKVIGDVIELKYGKALKAEERNDGNVPVYGSSGIVGCHNQSLVNCSGIIVGRKGNVGSVFWSHEPFFPIDTVYYVATDLSNFYVYHVLKDINFISSDSAVPGLNRNYAYSLPLIVPDPIILTCYDKVIEKLFQQLKNLDVQSQKLKEARDILLPRLMDGSIEV